MLKSLFLIYVKTAWIWLFIAALLGLFLRWQFVSPTDRVNYTFFMHGHSHVMLLGWLFNAMIAGYTFAFLPQRLYATKKYFWFFCLFQVSVLGMLIWFPIQGYKAIAIAFSSLHIFVSYVFVYVFWRDTKRSAEASSVALKFANWGWFFHLISTIGPFALGVIMAKGLKEGVLDELAVYYYLHFQYNGLFVFAIIGLFFWLLDQNKVKYSPPKANTLLYTMVISCILAYALSTLWVRPAVWVYVLAFIAAVLQLYALVILARMIWPIREQLRETLNSWTFILLSIIGIAFTLKHALQFLSAFDYFAILAYQIRNFTIAYLHLVFLGVLTLFFIALFIQQTWISIRLLRQKRGIVIFLVGILFSELLLVFQLPFANFQAYLPDYYLLLVLASLLLPVGIGMVWSFRNVDK